MLSNPLPVIVIRAAIFSCGLAMGSKPFVSSLR
jgi:hypothetical protein